MIELQKYASIRNNCCIGYFGPDWGIVKELVDARPVIERVLAGMTVYISCRPDFVEKLSGYNNVIPSNELKSYRNKFGYFDEIRSNTITSPVQDLLKGLHSDKD